MSTEKTTLKPGDPETTGHVWDEDLREFNNPLPRWWLWIFYATLIWGLGYTIAYPAWPLLREATPGLLGWSSRAEVRAEIERVAARNAAIQERLVETPLTEVAADPELNGFALNKGAAVFRTHCAQCHGAGAAGVQAAGYPNLLDDDWIWGGDVEAIAFTVRHGIRNTTDPDARWSEMPAFGEILTAEEIAQVVAYVQQISGQEHDAARAAAGATLFLDNCAGCHGEDGKGMRDQGAPNLTDAIWLYGGDEAALTHTVTYSRFGVMPAWGERLTEAQVRAVAVYVHGLGGGEAPPEE